MAQLHYSVMPPAHAETSGQGKTVFAVGTGMVDVEGQGMLWLVDPEKQVISSYVNDRGVGIAFIGARKIEFDMKMLEFEDTTPDKRYRVKSMKEAFTKKGK